ncbi:dienelactone hydrolase family protein, partial [Singulisphaera rosea]
MQSLLLAIAMTVAPTPIERGQVAFRPTPAESSVPEQFRLSAEVFSFEAELRLTHETYTVSAVRFPSPITTPDPENNTVHAEYFRPVGASKRPAVVVLHILGADFALSRYLAARLADRGVAALFLKLPYYGERRPARGEKRFLSTDMERSLLAMRQGVC